MTILDCFNVLSRVLLGVGFVDLWQQACQFEPEVQKAERFARNRQLREAVRIAEKTLSAWSANPGFCERLMRDWLLGNRLNQLKKQLEQWRKWLSEADRLMTNAKRLLKKDTGDPLQTQAVSQALAFYQRCTGLVRDDRLLREINQCQQELQRRQQFQGLVAEAEAQVEARSFKQAIATYHQAEQLYGTDAVKAAITKCATQVKQEETYCTALKQALQASGEGRLRRAIALLESALTNFPRLDGIQLLEQLQRTVKGREKFRQGLIEEQSGSFEAAASLYEAAKFLLPSPKMCLIRLGVVAIKTEDWATALFHLENVDGAQAAYLRGFAHAKQGRLQQAHREWHSLSLAEIGSQREILKSLSQRQRLISLQNIEQLVKDDLEKAKAASEAFIQKFGSDPLVQANLDDHIQPRLKASVWQGVDWRTIADTAERVWIEQPDMTSLHNWAVTTYYHVQDNPVATQSFACLNDLIVAWSTALANLRHDPALRDVPWLGNAPVDYDSVSSDLRRRLEEAIDTFRENRTNEYLQLRDCYRLEVVALRLMGNPPTQGMKIRDVFITPGWYKRCPAQLRNTCVDSINRDILRSLYTAWGLAVAACLEGDTQRAIQLKPPTKPAAGAAYFAQKFVAYHEGCYQLQHQHWREAMVSLKQAKTEIKASTTWQQEVDRLCGIQRQALSELTEHLEFAQFWYGLLESQPARSYLAEFKAEQTREKLVDEQISLEKALRELQEIKRIDEYNPVVLNLIERVEHEQELEEINQLFKNSQFAEMVRRARRSCRERVQYRVAEFFIDVLINGVKSGNLSDPETIQQLGRWAYEICPDEPAFQEVYYNLRLC